MVRDGFPSLPFFAYSAEKGDDSGSHQCNCREREQGASHSRVKSGIQAQGREQDINDIDGDTERDKADSQTRLGLSYDLEVHRNPMVEPNI